MQSLIHSSGLPNANCEHAMAIHVILLILDDDNFMFFK